MSAYEREQAVCACAASCGGCETWSFSIIARDTDLTPAKVQEQGFVLMSEHAAFMRPCAKHSGANGTQRDDAEDLRREGYSQPVRLSLEHGVTDPHDMHAFTPNDPEAKQA